MIKVQGSVLDISGKCTYKYMKGTSGEKTFPPAPLSEERAHAPNFVAAAGSRSQEEQYMDVIWPNKLALSSFMMGAS